MNFEKEWKKVEALARAKSAPEAIKGALEVMARGGIVGAPRDAARVLALLAPLVLTDQKVPLLKRAEATANARALQAYAKQAQAHAATFAVTKGKPKVQVSPAGVHRTIKVDTFRVTLLVHMEDMEGEDNDSSAKMADLEKDLSGSLTAFEVSDVSVEYESNRHVPAHHVEARRKAKRS